jgi:hypothetical protein
MQTGPKKKKNCKIKENKERGIKLWGARGGERTQPQVKWILASVCTKLDITACNLHKIQ